MGSAADGLPPPLCRPRALRELLWPLPVPQYSDIDTYWCSEDTPCPDTEPDTSGSWGLRCAPHCNRTRCPYQYTVYRFRDADTLARVQRSSRAYHPDHVIQGSEMVSEAGRRWVAAAYEDGCRDPFLLGRALQEALKVYLGTPISSIPSGLRVPHMEMAAHEMGEDLDLPDQVLLYVGGGGPCRGKRACAPPRRRERRCLVLGSRVPLL